MPDATYFHDDQPEQGRSDEIAPRRITVQTSTRGAVEVLAWPTTVPGLVVNPDVSIADVWIVTHEASGLHLGSADGPEQAMFVAEQIGADYGLDFTLPAAELIGPLRKMQNAGLPAWRYNVVGWQSVPVESVS